MVDKVFADWQGNPENEFPHLDTKRKIAPFGSKQFNKFTLTNIPPAKTLDFESNLCYCYDCDLEQDFDEVQLPKKHLGMTRSPCGKFDCIKYMEPKLLSCHSPSPLQGPISEECQGVSFHEKTPKITISVGITVPNHIGGQDVSYKICFGNSTCENGLISLFGNPGAVDKHLSISSDHFNIREDLVRMKLRTKLNKQH